MSRDQREIATAFLAHLRQLSISHSSNNRDGFDVEMDELRIVDHRVRSNVDEFYTASLATSVAKNRFVEVRANEGTRVRLRPMLEDSHGSYINANYVDGRVLFDVPFTYIATQAPLANTTLDFWRMVFENDVAFIVMLCGELEDGKVKSEVYWPREGGGLDFGVLQIKSLSERRFSDLVFRSFLLRGLHGEEHEVYHMQYTGWPDQNIPATSAPLMGIIQTMGKSELSVQNPVVVHCSGGIGRTGVFIALHVALAQFQLERRDLNIQRIVHVLKLCRTGMVQRKDQYVFLYYSALREMNRMIMSAEKGVNLLDLRRHEPTAIMNQATSWPVKGAVPQPSLALLRAAQTPPEVLLQPAIPHITRAAPQQLPPTRGLGPTACRSFSHAPPQPHFSITEAEQELLESYLKRQTASSRRLATHTDRLLNSSAGKMAWAGPRPGAAATQKARRTGASHDVCSAQALEEQLQHWKSRNRGVRFSRERAGMGGAPLRPSRRLEAKPSPTRTSVETSLDHGGGPPGPPAATGSASAAPERSPPLASIPRRAAGGGRRTENRPGAHRRKRAQPRARPAPCDARERGATGKLGNRRPPRHRERRVRPLVRRGPLPPCSRWRPSFVFFL
ncbi:putative tyrosine specific protein phosphatase [Trypanosoma rangeli]|uniref:Putative tyrosine specific protein phosphatase n=1 Tax=Trypanosoma rangeli TaxID=5698 RepID=A0A3R7L1Z6_TRYRA|nr:putative tyrosine specific protein phosphatase [Trypanosoma rangeli]RNF05961.1 putative tyrosine specific protein phosphatase [Trypanosoma rangeli]|eukprot:RNF05961.1 putative tyrosine specific protein phosphatase [Trypanosoma rangeli]